MQLDARPFAAEMGREAPAISPEALDVLAAYPFPGNVRELKNIVARALRESRDGTIEPGQLHLLSGEVPAPTTDPEVEIPLDLDEAEVWLVKRGSTRSGGNISEAARLLGTNRMRIYRVLGRDGGRRCRS